MLLKALMARSLQARRAGAAAPAGSPGSQAPSFQQGGNRNPCQALPWIRTCSSSATSLCSDVRRCIPARSRLQLVLFAPGLVLATKLATGPKRALCVVFATHSTKNGQDADASLPISSPFDCSPSRARFLVVAHAVRVKEEEQACLCQKDSFEFGCTVVGPATTS